MAKKRTADEENERMVEAERADEPEKAAPEERAQGERDAAWAEALSEVVVVRIAEAGVPHAVIAGELMLRGETRRVTRLQFQIAERAHPGRFEIVGG